MNAKGAQVLCVRAMCIKAFRTINFFVGQSNPSFVPKISAQLLLMFCISSQLKETMIKLASFNFFFLFVLVQCTQFIVVILLFAKT